MAFNPIQRNPAGRGPSPVRWYLAVMGMMALVLGAAHFAMQVHAQDQAERLIHEWVDADVASVGEVRYRMLRGALTLMDVHVQQEGVDIRIPMIELHGHLSAFAADEPRVDLLRIHGAQLSLSDSISDLDWNLLYQHEAIARMWAAAKDIQMTNLRLRWPLKEGASDSVMFTNVHLAPTHEGRALNAVGRVFDGTVRVSALEIDDQLSSGHLIWDQWRGAKVQTTLPKLNVSDGVLGGRLDWALTDKGWDINGQTDLQREGMAALSKLIFDGVIKQGKWKARVTSQAWPVQMFASYLPEPDGFRLLSAKMDGVMQLRGNAGHWRVGMEEAELYQVRLQSKGEPSHIWALKKASLKGLLMRWPNQTVWMDQLQLNEGEWPLELASLATPWKGVIQDVELQNVQPIVLSSGLEVLRLPLMNGHANWGSASGLNVNIRNAETEEPGHEVWRISGWMREQVNIRFNEVPAARFRSWLPKMLRDRADALSGRVSSKLVWMHDQQGGSLTGVVNVSDAEVKMGSERWLMKKCRIDIAKVGPGLAEQAIQSVRVKGWHYQAALKPLAVMAAETSSEKFAVLEPGWRIDVLKMSQGVVSAGTKDAVWMEDVKLHIKPMQKNALANINISGTLNNGTFSFDGSFDPFAKGFAAEMIKVDIRNALPFFVGDWLQVSGMPRLTRGRLYMDMSIKRSKQEGYEGKAYVRLHYGALEDGVYPHDPMLAYTGYQSHDLYTRLDQGRSARLFFPITTDELSWQGLGRSLLTELNKELAKGHAPVASKAEETQLLSQVRLHDAKRLTVNEKTRLRSMIAELHAHPKWMVELQPHLGQKQLDREMTKQVRYTQGLLTAYIVRGGISRARVLPVWPQTKHRGDQISGSIQLIARP